MTKTENQLSVWLAKLQQRMNGAVSKAELDDAISTFAVMVDELQEKIREIEHAHSLIERFVIGQAKIEKELRCTSTETT